MKSTPSLLVVVLVAALSIVPAGATGTAATPDGILAVSTFGLGDQSTTFVQTSSADAVARVTVTAPAGYTADLSAPPAARIGFAIVGLSDVPGTTASSASAPIVVEDAAQHAATPQAEACAPGAHASVWKASLSVLGQSFDLVIYVDHPVAGGGVVLRYCPVWPSTALPAGVTAYSVSLVVDDVFGQPRATGRYTWSAFVSRPRADLTPDESSTFEVRATEVVPHTLTLRSRYDAKRKSVVLSGKLTGADENEAGVEIEFTASTSSYEETTFFGPVKTNSTGEFSLSRHIEVSTLFNASAELPDGPCSAPSSAPAGCVRETIAAPPSASTLVRVRTAADPKLIVRRKDQQRARRANLMLADFPPGWQPYDAFSFFTCRAFTPRLADLTATGDVEGRIFASDSAAASSRATVYATETQARTAFARTARLGLARCIADEVKAAGASVLQLGSTPFEPLGAQTRAFRVVYADGDLVATIDLVSFRQGRLVVHLGFASATQPLIYADDLARKVAARARAG